LAILGDLVHTARQVDVRPGILFSLTHQRLDHWTPHYLRSKHLTNSRWSSNGIQMTLILVTS